MPLDRYVTDGDGYRDAEGVWYESLTELLQVGMLGFCLCGDAPANLRYIRDGLRHIARLTDERTPGVEFLTWYRAWHPAWIAEGITLFGNATSRQFFFYWAEANGLTEHGTSIPGWLTPKGRQLLDDLHEGLAGQDHHDDDL